MKNIEIKELNRDTILISNISKINEENYVELIKLEKDFTEKGVKYIQISLSIQDMENIKFLLDNGYYFKTNNGDKYILEKQCFRVKSWRISLTENCNYACFFAMKRDWIWGKLEIILNLVKKYII